MNALIDLPADLAPLGEAIGEGLLRVQRVFDQQLQSDLPPVQRLCRHIEAYRGKMLRPTLVLLSGLAAHPKAPRDNFAAHFRHDHYVVGAVCEMVHMATLVHDDVLDEAETRRRGQTVNSLHGNEAAVILGDYLIASAYHLCSTLATNAASLAVGRASMTLCAGELLQLNHRDDFSLDEATYFEIIDRKTAVLIATAAELGANASGATPAAIAALTTYGRCVGMAFQIQDDLLDLTGNEAAVGKSVGKDLEKGKITLPLLHHLASTPAEQRGRTLLAIEAVCGSDHATPAQRRAIVDAIRSTGSLDYAKATAERFITQAGRAIAMLPDSPARQMLAAMADAVITRSY